MANKRIHELTDTQASYDPDIYVAASDTTFTTGDKKMKIETIYPKTDTLSAAGDFNPATSTLRLGNGSNVESKVTVNNLIDDSDVVTKLKSELDLNVTTISFTGTPASGNTVTSLRGVKRGPVQSITGVIGNTASGGELYIGTISGYESPGYTVYFGFTSRSATDQDAAGRIDTDGKIYGLYHTTRTNWTFTVTTIGI